MKSKVKRKKVYFITVVIGFAICMVGVIFGSRLVFQRTCERRTTQAEARNLFELIHKRRKKSSTIFCSQFRESEWYQQICDGESTLADAIMDRISYDSYKIDIESVDPSKDLSMREVYGLDPAMAK